MASNPVFNQFNNELQQNQYAGFGGGAQASPYAQQGGAPQSQPQYGQTASGAFAAQNAATDQYVQQGIANAGTGERRMSYDDVIMKSAVLFGIMLAVAAVAWAFVDANPQQGTILYVAGIVGTLGLGFGLMFIKKIIPPLFIAYAVFEGLLVGAISRSYADIGVAPGESLWTGIVPQAILATLSVFVVMLIGYRTGFVKVTARARRIMMLMIGGYFVFSLVNLVLVWTGIVDSPFGIGGNGPLGIAISVFAVGLAAYSLAIDFDSIDEGVRAGVPEKYSWLMAHGILVTVVWLYLEILRLLGRLQSNN